MSMSKLISADLRAAATPLLRSRTTSVCAIQLTQSHVQLRLGPSTKGSERLFSSEDWESHRFDEVSDKDFEKVETGDEVFQQALAKPGRSIRGIGFVFGGTEHYI